MKKNTNHKYKNKIIINLNFYNTFFKTDDSNKNERIKNRKTNGRYEKSKAAVLPWVKAKQNTTSIKRSWNKPGHKTPLDCEKNAAWNSNFVNLDISLEK